jgi:hypothetical protein
VIDLTGESDDDSNSNVGVVASDPRPSSSSSPSQTRPRDPIPPAVVEKHNSRSGSRPGHGLMKSEKARDATPATLEWPCPICTLINNHLALRCDACQTERPLAETWSCMTCGESGMPHEFWTCRFCGTVKVQS